MIEFRCVNCGAVISIDSLESSEEVVCYSCDTRQPIPATARTAWAAGGSESDSDSVENHPALAAPGYLITTAVAGSFIVLGILGSILFFILIFKGSNTPTDAVVVFGSFFSCIFMIALGILIFCVRDIAINTWYSNNRKA